MGDDSARVSVHLCWSGPNDLDDWLTNADMQAYIAPLAYAGPAFTPLGFPRFINGALYYARVAQFTGERPGVPNTVVVLVDAPSTDVAATQVRTHPHTHPMPMHG